MIFYNMTRIITFTLFFFAASVARAQDFDSLRVKYNNLVIYRYGNTFMKGSTRLSFADLEPEMKVSKDAYALMYKSRREKKISFILNIVSFVCVGTNFLRLGNGQFDTTPTYLLLGGQFAFGLAASQYKNTSIKTLDRAIWLRNREILFPR